MVRATRTISSGSLVIVAILLLGLGLRLALSAVPPWYDELASIFFASQPLDHLWSDWMIRETNPPLFYTILKGFVTAFPHDLALMRLSTVLAGCLSIATCWLILRRLESVAAANIGAALLAVSPSHLNFSDELRTYIFGFLAVSLSLLGLLDWMRGRSTAALVLYAGGALAAIYLHTTLLVWPVAAMIALALVDGKALLRDRPALTRLMIVHGLMIAGAAWWLRVTYLQMTGPAHGNISWIEHLSGPVLLATIRHAVLLNMGPVDDMTGKALAGLAQAGIGVACLIGLVARWKRVEVRFLLAATIVALLLFALVDLRQPVFLTRTLFWINVFTASLAAIGLSVAIRSLSGRIALGGLLVIMLATAALAYRERVAMRTERENWFGAVDQAAVRPGGAVVVLNAASAIPVSIACAIRTAGRRCPFTILMIQDPGARTDFWSKGQYPVTRDQDLAGRLRCFPHFDVFRRTPYPVQRLKALGITLPGASVRKGNLLGPYRLPGALRTGRSCQTANGR